MKAIDLCKKYEGCKLKAYLDPVGIWTIGWGHTGPEVVHGMTITQSEADVLLSYDLLKAKEIVEHAVKVDLTDNQYQALTSFVYNVGPGKVGKKSGFVYLKDGGPSTMLREINDGHFLAAANEFPKWNKAGGQVLPGLVKRRADEKALFEAVNDLVA